jgi:antitoxin component of MazEF toxin-antitoxin module
MGYRVKVQKVERPTNKSFYVNLPAALAESAEIEKGEDMEWQVEDRNCFILRRVKARKSLLHQKRK